MTEMTTIESFMHRIYAVSIKNEGAWISRSRQVAQHILSFETTEMSIKQKEMQQCEEEALSCTFIHFSNYRHDAGT